jgi:hypothetical protein
MALGQLPPLVSLVLPGGLEGLWLADLVMILVWIAAVLMFSGCGSNGTLLHDFACKGKATIVGGGSGFMGINGTIDCGDGFMLKSGTDANQVMTK